MVTAAQVIANGETYLGDLYVLGGESHSGLDCSALIQLICIDTGLDPRCPRTSQTQWRHFPRTNNPQPGAALVFFNVPGDGPFSEQPGHVGLYLGPGTMLDAPETWIAPGVRGRVSIQPFPFPGGTVMGYCALPVSQPVQPPSSTLLEATMLSNCPTGGLWVAGADGGVFSFSGAPYFGSLPGLHVVPSKPITGIAATPTGKGYWLCAEDGGVFAFGDAGFHGNIITEVAKTWNPCVGIVAGPPGSYTLVQHLPNGVPVPWPMTAAAPLEAPAKVTAIDLHDQTEHTVVFHPASRAA